VLTGFSSTHLHSGAESEERPKALQLLRRRNRRLRPARPKLHHALGRELGHVLDPDFVCEGRQPSQQDLLLTDCGVGQVPGLNVLQESLDGVLDADEGGVRALTLPLPEEVLAGFPRTHVEGPPNLLAPKCSLDPKRALAAPMLPALGSMPAVREMPPVEGQHPESIARNTHLAVLIPLSYLLYWSKNGGGGGN
jgi:hypothetical protein